MVIRDMSRSPCLGIHDRHPWTQCMERFDRNETFPREVPSKEESFKQISLRDRGWDLWKRRIRDRDRGWKRWIRDRGWKRRIRDRGWKRRVHPGS